MRTQLYNLLSTNAAISAVVGDRIYPARVPKADALPYIYFEFNGRDIDYQQDGYTGYEQLSVDISCCGSSVAVCDDLSDKVFTALNVQNTQVGDTGDKKELCRAYLKGESDNYFLFDGSEDGVREITQTYSINYMEA